MSSYAEKWEEQREFLQKCAATAESGDRDAISVLIAEARKRRIACKYAPSVLGALLSLAMHAGNMFTCGAILSAGLALPLWECMLGCTGAIVVAGLSIYLVNKAKGKRLLASFCTPALYFCAAKDMVAQWRLEKTLLLVHANEQNLRTRLAIRRRSVTALGIAEVALAAAYWVLWVAIVPGGLRLNAILPAWAVIACTHCTAYMFLVVLAGFPLRTTADIIAIVRRRTLRRLLKAATADR